jgi:hypothetical protein
MHVRLARLASAGGAGGVSVKIEGGGWVSGETEVTRGRPEASGVVVVGVGVGVGVVVVVVVVVVVEKGVAVVRSAS